MELLRKPKRRRKKWSCVPPKVFTVQFKGITPFMMCRSAAGGNLPKQAQPLGGLGEGVYGKTHNLRFLLKNNEGQRVSNHIAKKKPPFFFAIAHA